MPRRIPVEELEKIVALIAPHRDGVGVDEIRSGLDPNLSERTLQRHLCRLAAEGRIRARGTTRGKRYFPADSVGFGGVGTPRVLSGGDFIKIRDVASGRVSENGRKTMPPYRRVSDSGVTNMVRGRAEGPCVALLFDNEQTMFPRELLVELMRGLGWQVLDLRFFGRTLPRGLVPDGVFTSIALGEPQADQLQAIGCPIVRLGVLPSAGDHMLPAVVEDRAAAGRMAAEHFAERRFRHVGFIVFGGMGDNRTMYEAMRDRAGELGCECHLLRHRPLTREEVAFPSSEHRRLRREELARWLSEVPKPIGMLAWSDHLGGRICVAANEAGLKIPSEVAVLGYGNKTSDCVCTPVPLSSIDPGFLQQARAAVQLMQRQLDGGRSLKEPVMVPPVGIEVRESTDALAVVDPAVARALRYMWDHLERDLGTADVAAAVGLKRRALERAFRKSLDSTIRDELCRRRVEQLKLLLRTTDRPIIDLAPRVGFRSPQYLSNAFRSAVGMSPKQYRRISQADA